MSLFDHLVGADEQCRRHGDPECFSRLEIDNSDTENYRRGIIGERPPLPLRRPPAQEQLFCPPVVDFPSWWLLQLWLP